MNASITIIYLAVALVLSLAIYGILTAIERLAGWRRAHRQLIDPRDHQRQRSAIKERQPLL